MTSKSLLIAKLKSDIQAVEAMDNCSCSSSRFASREHPSTTSDPVRRTKRQADRSSDLVDSDRDRSNEAYAKVLRCLSVREQSSSRIKDKLRLSGYAEDEIESAIAKASKYGILDDKRYAEALIREHIRVGKGLASAVREIESLGIDPNELRSLQDHLECGQSEYDRAFEVLVKHPPRSKNPRQSAYRKLVSKGFSSDIASRAARDWQEAYCSF